MANLSILDRYPATLVGHVAFLDFLSYEVQCAVKGKQQQLAEWCSSDTLAGMVSEIRWAEARKRIAALADLPADIVKDTADVLASELNVETIEQIDERLQRSTKSLREAVDRYEAERYGVPVEVFANLTGSLRSEDIEAAVWVYREARELVHTVDKKPEGFDGQNVENGIRNRRRAFRCRKARSHSRRALAQRIEKERDFFRELKVLRSLLPPDTPTLDGWEGPPPRGEIKTPTDLRAYLRDRQMHSRRFGKSRIKSKLLAFTTAVEAMRNAMREFNKHLGEPEWDGLRPDPWPDDPKNAREAERALSDLIFRLRPTRAKAKSPLGDHAQLGDRDSAGEAAAADAKPAGATLLQPIKRPPEAAFMAWRLRDFSGINKQGEIATKMIELGTLATQGQVSRWLNEVELYLDAGNILPDLPTPLTDRPQSIDPTVIDMGKRADGHTPRQRLRRDPNSHDK